MDELVKLVVQKTGLPEDKAKMAVEVVLAFLKQRLPQPMAEQLEGLLGGSGGPGGLAGLAKGLGGILGRK